MQKCLSWSYRLGREVANMTSTHTELPWFSWQLSGIEYASQYRRYRFDPWVRNISWRKKMATHSNILAWEFPRSLASYSPWGCKSVRHSLVTTASPMLHLPEW